MNIDEVELSEVVSLTTLKFWLVGCLVFFGPFLVLTIESVFSLVSSKGMYEALGPSGIVLMFLIVAFLAFLQIFAGAVVLESLYRTEKVLSLIHI